MTVLRTSRLQIRPLSEADLPALVAYRNDPDVSRYQGWVLPYTRGHARSLLTDQDLGADGWVQHGIYSLAGEFLGDVAVNTQGQQAELGITLARHAQGQGYAREALEAVLNYTFRELKLHRVHAGIDPRNAPVARLLTRLGFRHEGTHRLSYWHRDQWTDEAVYAVLKDEWQR